MVTSAACSTQFKLSAQDKFVYQPVILPKELKEALRFFVERVRGLLRFSGVSRVDLGDVDGFLFCVWGNVHEQASSDAIPNFTARSLGIRLTSTNLRAVTETEAEQAFRDGRITEGQRISIRTVNGHGGRVRLLIFCY
jgi:hypothetical protein